ncbi:hypothetical protein CWR43_13375 [Rhizobium sullae]|uniref:Uncharacterized protein n=1 Tax=Rhizobium sullae TaxID=50338 RepID=A0A2N0DAE3_RHISU|nr:hypothetical protein [Rhizobium sullae]PKA43052.1 hypothetical protein CWR43_13375 [Rhizobium sullae]
MSEQPSIHMGHGQMVDIVGKTSDKWEIIFSEAGVADYKAPPLKEIEADAIDVSGKIYPLAIAAGPSESTVVASGQVEGAYRVRVRVWHGTHFHTREAFLPGAAPIEAVTGPNGGSLATFDEDLQLEVKPIDATTWELFFLKDTTLVGPLAADAVVVQAIGPKAEDYQIRNLKTENPGNGRTLIVEGKIKDAVYARISITKNGGEAVRSIPIFLAN